MEPQVQELKCSIYPRDVILFEVLNDELWVSYQHTDISVRVDPKELPAIIKLLTEFTQSRGVTL